MADPSDWIYCRLVDRGSFIFPRRPFWLGQVEFSDKGKDDAACAAALTASMSAFAVSEEGEGWEHLVRARLLLPRVDEDAARKFGAFHLAETLQAFNAYLSIGMSELRATDAGYLYDVRKRTVSPLIPPWKSREFKGISAMLDEIAHHPQHVLNTLFVAPKAFGELGDAFRRSSHWRDLAERAEDEGEALLLYWMASECLCKQRHDEPIGPKLLAACGFPMGQIAQSLGAPLARQLAQLQNHRSWRRQLTTLFDALRIARNQIVHAGYRYVDLPKLLRDDQRTLGMAVLPVVTKCLASMALQALNLRHRTIAAMWERYELVLDPAGLVRHAEWIMARLDSSPWGAASRRWK
jgi:hypothetical protein